MKRFQLPTCQTIKSRSKGEFQLAKGMDADSLACEFRVMTNVIVVLLGFIAQFPAYFAFLHLESIETLIPQAFPIFRLPSRDNGLQRPESDLRYRKADHKTHRRRSCRPAVQTPRKLPIRARRAYHCLWHILGPSLLLLQHSVLLWKKMCNAVHLHVRISACLDRDSADNHQGAQSRHGSCTMGLWWHQTHSSISPSWHGSLQTCVWYAWLLFVELMETAFEQRNVCSLSTCWHCCCTAWSLDLLPARLLRRRLLAYSSRFALAGGQSMIWLRNKTPEGIHWRYGRCMTQQEWD